MKGNGLKGRRLDMVKENKYFQIDNFMKAGLKIINQMEKVEEYIQMEIIMKANLLTVKVTALV